VVQYDQRRAALRIAMRARVVVETFDVESDCAVMLSLRGDR
jgi:hypothetical protein